MTTVRRTHTLRRAIGATLVITAGLVAMPRAGAVPVGPELPVNTTTSGSQFDPAIAVSDSGASVVAWTSLGQDGADGGIVAQRFDPAGLPVGGELLVNTYTASTQSSPAVAMDADGDFVVTWQSSGQDGSLWGVYARRFRADGTPAGAEVRVNTTTSREQLSPAVAMDDDGDFVVTWASFAQDGSQYGVFAQRFAADGTPAGGEFQVNTYTNGNQNAPAVEMTGDGRFVIAWQSFTQNGGVGSDPYLRRYDAGGEAIGAPVRADTYTANDQGLPDVALDDDGAITVVWRSIGQDGSMAGVFLQRYTWAGATVGGETMVNTYTSRDQTSPSVDAGANGEVVVAWASDGQDGSSFGIHAQRYDASGAADGGEEQVNTYTVGVQTAPVVAVDAGGSYVVAWQSAEQDGSGQGVFAQRFLMADPEVCDGLDNDRDGAVDDGVTTTYFADADADGHGDPLGPTEACARPDGFAPTGEDADDDDPTVYPGAPERCDGKDNDQDSTVDEGVTTTYYVDADGDGFGERAVAVEACAAPAGYVDRDGDGDDADGTVYPGAPERCDGKDNDQDGAVDDGWPDADGDGMADCVDPDDDNDGIEDGRDPDVLAGIITSIPRGALASGGSASAMLTRLDAVERQLLSGSTPSVNQLQAMRAWMDGCDGTPSETPDNNDKVLDCAAQHDTRTALDALIANLA